MKIFTKNLKYVLINHFLKVLKRLNWSNFNFQLVFIEKLTIFKKSISEFLVSGNHSQLIERKT